MAEMMLVMFLVATALLSLGFYRRAGVPTVFGRSARTLTGALRLGLVIGLGGLILAVLAMRSEVSLLAIVITAFVLFITSWHREFRYLMSLGDDAFPGRNDKLIWALLLIVLPPVGVLTFWSYRRSRHPVAKPVARAGQWDLS